MANAPEHLVSEAMKKPPAPHPKEEPVVFTASVNIKQPIPVTKNG